MAVFELITFIKNSPQVIFDLSRSIDLHKISTADSREEAVDGITRGLIGLNETVTRRAFHMYRFRKFTSKITQYDFPFSFTDEMIKGDLKSFSHTHIFAEKDGGTVMKDNVSLEAPYGILGKFVMDIYLKDYFKRSLAARNEVIKEFAESGKYRSVLNIK